MARFGNLVGYEPSPTPGMTNFVTLDGRKIQAFGAEAEAMKARLDQANAAMPQPTASVIGPAALVNVPAPAAPAAPPPARADFAAPVPGAGPPTFNAKAAAADLVGGPAPPAAPPAPPAMGGPSIPGRIPVAPGHVYNPQTGLIEVYHGASGGSKGGWTDTSQSVRGAFPEDPEYIAGVKQAHQAGDQAQQLQLQGEQAVADAEHSRNFKLALQYEDAQRQAQDRADSIESRVRELDGTYDRLNNEYNSSKVDPRRMFAGGKNWIYGLVAGLGTLGAGMSKTPNFTMQVLQQRIADDIDAQKAEVAIKRDAADNAYKRLLQETGSSDLAKKALEGIQLSKLNSEFEVMAKDGRDKQRQAQGQAMAAASAKRLLDWREEYHRAALGDVTKNMTYVAASPGSPAGWYPASDQLATAAKVQGLQQGVANLQKTAAEAAKGADAGPPIPAERTKQLALSSKVITQAEGILQQLPPGDQSEWGDPAGGPIDTSSVLGNAEAANKLNEDTAGLATSIQIETGMGSTADDRTQAGELVGEGRSVAARRRGAEEAARNAAQRIALELSTLPPAQQQQALQSLDPTVRAYVQRARGGK